MIASEVHREVEQVIDRILADLVSGDHRGVVVDSPPGAGKSTLVVRTAIEIAHGGDSVMVIAQTNEQVDDLVNRLAQAAPDIRIGRLSAQDYAGDQRVAHPNVDVAHRLADLNSPPIIVGTAAKWLYITDGPWPWAIIDEAYQMRSDMLLRVAPRFERALFVGDPGQLDPFSTVDIDRWTGLTWDPLQSAVAAMQRNNPDLPVHQLPVSWRLPATSTRPVSEAFYPFTGFRAATTADQRLLTFQTRGFGSPVDATLDLAATTGWALHELPARHTIRTDAEAIDAIATLAGRFLQRGAIAHSERAPHETPVTAHRIAIGTVHRDQAAAIRQALRQRRHPTIRVDTANRLQGSEYDIVIVLHPLSGRHGKVMFASCSCVSL